MKRSARITALAATLAAGIAAAVLIVPAAQAWDYGNLPPGCSKGPTLVDTSGPSYFYKVVCNGVTSPYLHYGSNPYPYPPTDPTFQTNLDAFVNANYTAPVTTTVAPTTTTVATSTTTSTAPAPTTTAAAPTSTVTQTVTAPAATPPIASFTYAPTGLAVTFTDTSIVGSSAITKVTWLFGDGSDDTGPQVTHTYAASGTFNVVEFVTDANGLTDRATQTLTLSLNVGTPKVAETLSAPLSNAATATFGQPLAVFCVTSWGRLKAEGGQGAAFIDSHQANIWRAGCAALMSKRGPVAAALLVLGHEVAHALGIASERTADCYALKRLPRLEQALHIADRGYRATDAWYVRGKWGRC